MFTNGAHEGCCSSYIICGGAFILICSYVICGTCVCIFIIYSCTGTELWIYRDTFMNYLHHGAHERWHLRQRIVLCVYCMCKYVHICIVIHVHTCRYIDRDVFMNYLPMALMMVASVSIYSTLFVLCVYVYLYTYVDVHVDVDVNVDVDIHTYI